MANQEASIVFKAYDEITDAFLDIENSSAKLDKELEVQRQKLRQLGERWKNFTTQEAETAAKALEVKTAMDAAKKAFKATGEEADKVKFEKLRAQYKGLAADARAYGEAADLTRRTMKDTAEYARKMGTTTGTGTGPGGKLGAMLGMIGQAGGYAMVGQLGSQWAQALGGSALGGTGGTYLGGALSGAGSGAAIGTMIAPGVGTAVGGLIGGVAGLAGAGAQHFEDVDQALKSHVRTKMDEQVAELKASEVRGSAMAGQREMDAISMSTLLGGEKEATAYLRQLVDLANDTPFLYSDLMSMSKAMAPYSGKDGDRMLQELKILGDAGAALGHSTADVQTVGVQLGRMRVSDKAQLEDLNILSDRGIDSVGILSKAKGVEQKKMYELISKGQISGRWAAEVIFDALTEEFAGSMERQSKTFSGLSSTVEGLNQELDAAMGEAFNRERSKGLEAQQSWLSGPYAKQMEEANAAWGKFQAEQQNIRDAMEREAVIRVFESDEYRQATLRKDATEQQRLIAEAKVHAENEYMATEGAQKLAETERQMIQSVREDSAANSESYMVGYRRNQEYTKGWMSAYNDPKNRVPATPKMENGHTPGQAMHGSGYASGLRRVPYDDFPARLHQGERVLTRQEADRLDHRGSGAPVVHINVGSMAVRSEEDIDAVAGRLAKLIRGAVRQDGGM